jgi:hypothetical protein
MNKKLSKYFIIAGNIYCNIFGFPFDVIFYILDIQKAFIIYLTTLCVHVVRLFSFHCLHKQSLGMSLIFSHQNIETKKEKLKHSYSLKNLFWAWSNLDE